MKLRASKPLFTLFLCLWAATIAVAQQGAAPRSGAGTTIAAVRHEGAEAAPNTTHVTATSGPPFDPLVRSGFDHFYNLDYDRAVGDLEADLKAHPDDPFALNYLLTAHLFRELYHMGVLDTAYYANNSFLGQRHRQPDPKEQQRIRSLISTALKLENERLKHNSEDVNMLYARGVTQSLRATYTALVERSWFAALRSALRARRDHERVLRLDSSYTDAKMVVGIHNYVVGSLPWGVKLAVAAMGIGGSKKRGIQYLYDVANCSSCQAKTDARVVLALLLRREHRYPEALDVVRSLTREYPRNVLFALEEPNLLRSMEENQGAQAGYRKIFQKGEEGRFNGHYELAAYSLGELLRSEKKYEEAADAYSLVDRIQDTDPEVRQRADLAAGEMYDLIKKRNLALEKYHTVLLDGAGSPPAEAARKHIKEAYQIDNGS